MNVLVIVLIAVAVGAEANKKAQALEKARHAYQYSLNKLKANPTSADLRQVTLDLKRKGLIDNDEYAARRERILDEV
jgi:hypothetical protein